MRQSQKTTQTTIITFTSCRLQYGTGVFYKLSLAMRDGGGPSGARVMHLGAVVEREDQMSGNLRAATCIMREMSK